jgi:hypothetical protein
LEAQPCQSKNLLIVLEEEEEIRRERDLCYSTTTYLKSYLALPSFPSPPPRSNIYNSCTTEAGVRRRRRGEL